MNEHVSDSSGDSSLTTSPMVSRRADDASMQTTEDPHVFPFPNVEKDEAYSEEAGKQPRILTRNEDGAASAGESVGSNTAQSSQSMTSNQSHVSGYISAEGMCILLIVL